MKKPFTIGGRSYATKKEATAEIRQLIAAMPHAVPFQSDMLRDLIAEHHYYCAPNKLIPLAFRKDGHPLYYEFMAEFSGIGWHGVSWRKCFNPPTFESEIRAFLRADFNSVREAVLAEFAPECTYCGAHATDVHHASQSFESIVAAVMPLFSEDDRRTWCGHDWLLSERFSFPVSHPAYAAYKKLESVCAMLPLCGNCHKKAHAASGKAE